MRSTIRTSAILATLLGLTATAGQAQSANITATATVLTAITVTGASPLDFGTVFPGVAKTIAIADVGAGRFDLTGQASANVNVSFILPTDLVDGANNLPIGSWTGYRNATAATTGGTAFTPIAGTTAAAFSGAGALFVYVGGTVTPAGNQAAGTYTGTVTLTAAYF
jgi:hypothetical protein